MSAEAARRQKILYSGFIHPRGYKKLEIHSQNHRTPPVLRWTQKKSTSKSCTWIKALKKPRTFCWIRTFRSKLCLKAACRVRAERGRRAGLKPRGLAQKRLSDQQENAPGWVFHLNPAKTKEEMPRNVPLRSAWGIKTNNQGLLSKNNPGLLFHVRFLLRPGSSPCSTKPLCSQWAPVWGLRGAKKEEQQQDQAGSGFSRKAQPGLCPRAQERPFSSAKEERRGRSQSEKPQFWDSTCLSPSLCSNSSFGWCSPRVPLLQEKPPRSPRTSSKCEGICRGGWD